jgi:hypothetical protein
LVLVPVFIRLYIDVILSLQKTAVKTAVKVATETETISIEEELQVKSESKGVFNIKLYTMFRYLLILLVN